MDPQPVTADEIATLLRDIRLISEDRNVTPGVRAAILARKTELLARLGDRQANSQDGDNNDRQDQDEDHGAGTEPFVDAPAGLIGNAIELLDLCDELLNHPGHECIDARIHTLISVHHLDHHAIGTGWPHTAFGATADGLQDILDASGIIVEPTLRGRPSRRHRPH